MTKLQSIFISIGFAAPSNSFFGWDTCWIASAKIQIISLSSVDVSSIYPKQTSFSPSEFWEVERANVVTKIDVMRKANSIPAMTTGSNFAIKVSINNILIFRISASEPSTFLWDALGFRLD